ncbi:histidine acid phosphatase [Oesophagostomum dentatum]|uniref:Histidine acid phosphatase n=1 Tax=Oesophagostomum dentatum TaxID=61180 RepID=A0A0B1T4T7_OESDE|nr:histidine acid phosphatase [Oesophagostomum dentatum]
MRKFVGKLISDNYNRTEAKFFSSSANRCQMTLQVALAGLYKPVDWADWDVSGVLPWSPVPYTIDDPMLRMYSVKECKNSDKVWKPIDDDTLPSLKEAKNRSAALLAYVGKETGWNMSSLSRAADFADNLIEIELYNASYPEWVSHPTLEGYDEKKLVKEALSFAEIHQIACADYEPCRDLMSGVWLKHILTTISDVQNGKGPQLAGYASHNEITLSVMKNLGIVKDELTTSAGFVLEFRMKPMPSVRLLAHDPNPIDKHVIYKAELIPELADKAAVDGFISLEDFEAHIKSKASIFRLEETLRDVERLHSRNSLNSKLHEATKQCQHFFVILNLCFSDYAFACALRFQKHRRFFFHFVLICKVG